MTTTLSTRDPATTSSAPSPRPATLGDAAVLAVWAGIVSGLGEAALTWVLRYAPTISAYRKAGIEVFWVAPAANVVLLFGLALFLIVGSRLVRKRLSLGAMWSCLACIGFATVLGYPRVLHVLALALLCAGLGVLMGRAIRGNEQRFVAWLKRGTPWIVTAAVLAGVTAESSRRLIESRRVAALPAARSTAPNVLIVVVDALRGDRLSGVGYARHTTPNMDALAKESVQYLNAWSTAPWTAPSHETILTGRYTFEHKVDYPVPDIHNTYPRLPETLARFGYRSGLFSANLGPGTEEYLTGRFQHVDTYTPYSTLSRLTIWRVLRGGIDKTTRIDLPPPKRARTVNDRFLSWTGKDTNRPFFALLNYIDVHDHVNPEWRFPPEFDSRFGDVSKRRRKDRTVTFDDVGLFYDAALSYVDDALGRLVAELKRRGIADNTIIIVTADHGEAIGEHGDDGHQSSLYREQIHVPLIIRYPKRIAPSTRVEASVSLVSLASTIVSLAGMPGEMPHVPMPLTDSASTPGRLPVLAEFSTLHRGQLLKSLIDDHWHYIRQVQTGEEKLFDFRNDPLETRDLAPRPESQPILRDFRQQLARLFPADSLLNRRR